MLRNSRIFRSFAVILSAALFAISIDKTSIGEVNKQVESTSTADNDNTTFVKQHELTSIDGIETYLLDQQTNFTVVCFFATECPLSRFYMQRLESMQSTYGSGQIAFRGISCNDQDSIEDLVRFRDELKLSFPLIKDRDQAIARQFAATRNPHVYVVDQEERIQYQGRIDDQYMPGLVREEAKQHELREALDALLEGRANFVAKTEPFGCKITYRKKVSDDNSITYKGQIQKILQDRCVECHRSGDIGPFSLTEYEEVIGWGDMMLEVIDQHRMPPWHADDSVEFVNARQMPAEEKELLRKWVAGGMPIGDQELSVSKNNMASQHPENLSAPDLRLRMSDTPYTIPAEGTVDYQYFVVDPKLKEDKWVRSAKVVPGNRAVVHHVIVFVRPPDDQDFRNIGLVAGYVPGQTTYELPKGYAQRIQAGSRFVFQMHYTPNGTQQQDCSSIELYFEDESKVTHQVHSVAGLQQDFEIPPFADNHEVSGVVHNMPSEGEILSVSPHMHVRGKSFKVVGQSANEEQTLLNVPHYDFNWQHNYAYTKPFDLSKLEQVRFTASFNNSDSNFVNPDPSQYVMWGDQTWEEMAVVFFAVAVPFKPEATNQEAPIAMSYQQNPNDRDSIVADRVRERLQALDKNRDGFIAKSEVPSEFAYHVFSRIDLNRDDAIDSEELSQYVKLYY